MKYNIAKALDFIVSRQNADGSFATYELYPIVMPDRDWTELPDPSPFISANILYSLMQAKNNLATGAIKKGVENLWASKERGGYWRFWPLKSKQHPVPFDMDDTCLCSFILEKNGYRLSNKSILLNNKNAAGYFKTWLTPNFKTAITNPVFSFGLAQDCIASMPTVRAGDFMFNDYEPAVAANALLYLGDNENTSNCLQLVIDEIQNNTMPLQFYADEIIVYYHIARAYVNGVKGLGVLKNIIVERLKNRFNSTNQNVLLTLMAANVLLDFNAEIILAEQLIDSVVANEMYPDQWKCVPYFASKNRNFLAGSPELTAALFVEACSKFNQRSL